MFTEITDNIAFLRLITTVDKRKLRIKVNDIVSYEETKQGTLITTKYNSYYVTASINDVDKALFGG